MGPIKDPANSIVKHRTLGDSAETIGINQDLYGFIRKCKDLSGPTFSTYCSVDFLPNIDINSI